MPENGRLPDSDLRPVAGGGRLIPTAAAAWNALGAHVYRKTGVRIAPNGPLSTYRTYEQQVYMKQVYGSNAATPGTSNHGWGLAVDTDDHELINRYGAPFGWQKAWSDASWEPWHFRYASDHYSGPDPGPDYTDEPPAWVTRVRERLRAARARYASKRERRRHAKTDERRSALHRAITKLRDAIARMVKRLRGWK